MDYEVCVCWLAAATVRFGELSVLRETILQSSLGCAWWEELKCVCVCGIAHWHKDAFDIVSRDHS